MSEFTTYLQLGFEHISDIQGYDHMLFIITLCAVYSIRDWKKVLVLVTAFTIGHSVTLALSALNIFRMNADVVELLIPVTILLTALHNVTSYKSSGTTFGKQDWIHYALALGFGFIHGMGFSNFFRALMGPEESIVGPLFAFNVGLEIGQILVVIGFYLVYALLRLIRPIDQTRWMTFVSGAGAGVALVMILDKV